MSSSELPTIHFAVLDSLAAHISVLDQRGTIVMVNSAWKRYGCQNGWDDPNFGVGQNYFDICERVTGEAAEYSRQAADGIGRVIRGEIPEYSLDYPTHALDKESWFRLVVTPLLSERWPGVIVSHINITEPKTVTARQASMLDEVGQSVVATDLDGIIIYANRFATHLHGWSHSELLGRNVRDLWLSPDQVPGQDIVSPPFGTLTSWTGEPQVHHSDGRNFPVQLTLAPMLDATGNVTGSIAISTDLSERRQAEQALHQSQARFRFLTEAIPQVVWMAGAEGGIIYLNRQWHDVTGLTAD